LYRMTFVFIQANVSVNDRGYIMGPAMTSTQLQFLPFPTQLGYFKTLSIGKLGCCNCNAHALSLVSRDCWVGILTPDCK